MTLSDVSAAIYTTTGSDNDPDTQLYGLTNPTTLEAGVNRFTAPSGATLTPGTFYAVVILTSGLSMTYERTSSDEEDTAETGWAIEHQYFTNSINWTDRNGRVCLIAVNGTSAVSTDATLSGLALEDGNGNGITLDPVFAPGTTSYTAAVVNRIDTVTVKPTVNESHATVAYFDGADVVIADADSNKDDQQVELVVGENTIKVTVTAQDTTTIETYTVTVTRASSTAAQTVVTLVSNQCCRRRRVRQ